ncbi:MAG: dynamin family protein [Candidatus Latescibacteria bacterium]|nr:dynamin family protein [Candidatus Latescibacterota bacterium]
MDCPFAILTELEQKISDIEQSMSGYAAKTEVSVSSPVQVVWKCIDPTDVWSLLASVTDDRITYLSDDLKFREARPVAVTMGYADTCKLSITFNKPVAKHKFRALDDLAIDHRSIRDMVESGSLILGSNQQKPWKLENTRLALRKLQDVLLNSPNDLCQSIESIRFEAPCKRLENLEININAGEINEYTDVIWLVVPPRQLTHEEAGELVSILHNDSGIVIIPILGLPWNVLHDHGEDYSDPDLIERHLEVIDSGFGDTYSGELFPALPLYRNAFITDKTERGNFEPKCLDLIWNTTHTSGYNRLLHRINITGRYENLLETLMKPPQNVLNLLRYHAHLKHLRSLPAFNVETADKEAFLKLRDEGMREYSEQAKNLGKRTVKNWLPTATFNRFRPSCEIIGNFCNKASKVDFLKNAKDEFLQMAKEIADVEFSILVIGRFKSGKTTFINTLLGEDFLNTDLTPNTAVPWRIHNTQDKPQAVIHDRKSGMFPLIQVGNDLRKQGENEAEPEEKFDSVYFLRVDETDAVGSWLKDDLIDSSASSLIMYSGDSEERIKFDSKRAENILKVLGKEISAYKANSAGHTEKLLSITSEFLQNSDIQAGRLSAEIVFSNPESSEITKFTAKNINNKLRSLMDTCETSRKAFRISYGDIYLPFSDPYVLANCLIIDSPGAGSIYSHHDEIIRDAARKAHMYIIVLELDRPESGADLEFISEISRMAHDYNRPLVLLASKADKIASNGIDEKIRQWEDVLKSQGIDIKKDEIIPIAPYLSRYPESLALPAGHDKESLGILLNNFQKVIQNMRDHIEISQGMAHIGKFTQKIEEILLNSGKKFSEINKALKRRYTEVEKSAVTPEKVEQVEKAEVFWGEFVSATMKRIEFKSPGTDVKNLCRKTANAFEKYLLTTPATEELFENCKKQHWPAIANKCMENMKKFLHHKVSTWEQNINQELESLDEFREENFPDEPHISRKIVLETDEIPFLQVSLAVPVTKKPGILKSLLSFSKEENEWKEQIIIRFRTRIDRALESYENEIMWWLKNISGKVEKITRDIEEEARRNAESAKKRIIEYKAILETGDTSARLKQMDKLHKEMQVLDKLQKSSNNIMQEWEKAKNSLPVSKTDK